jgi:hypothetical protein
MPATHSMRALRTANGRRGARLPSLESRPKRASAIRRDHRIDGETMI